MANLSDASMQAALNGMFWKDLASPALPHSGDPGKASGMFHANLAAITWNTLSTLEQNPATLTQTSAILAGQSVDGINMGDLMQVKKFADGSKKLIEMVRSGAFNLDVETACALHKYVGKDEALDWGVLRYSKVSIQGSAYLPPEAELLPKIAETGFRFLRSQITNPIERAFAAFLFMSRSQFFFDANKRTSVLMMNGILLSNGFYPVTVLKKDSEVFYAKLAVFYETGNASEMMEFLSSLAGQMYG